MLDLPRNKPATDDADTVCSRDERTSPPVLDRPIRAAVGRLTGGFSPIALNLAYVDWSQHLLFSPDKQIDLVFEAHRSWSQYLGYCVQSCLEPNCESCVTPSPQDQRFKADSWKRWPYLQFHQGFLLTQQWWQEATTNVSGVSKHHENVVSFVTRQLLDIMSPANFPATNPEVQAETFASGGQNFIKGAMHFMDDAQRRVSGLPPAGIEDFVVGSAVATTAGHVIYRNDLIELIQYTPTTDTVHPEPVLIVPAWIMKYYILDLSPENSLVKYLVENGHAVFMVSWKNPSIADHDLGMEDYRRLGVMSAVNTVRTTVPGQKIHGVGYCLGGTLLSIAAAAMTRGADERFATLTLFAAQTDFSEAGELMAFIDDAQVGFLENMMAEEGYLDTKQMAGVFQLLRSNDLIWSSMVQTYLMGQRQPMIDLMAWNADATRMPARMHSEYLRQLFLSNDLANDRYRVGGRPISLRDIRIPIFAVSTLSDHVAPWRSVYKIHARTKSDVTFVLSNGGHNAGIVNPPGNARRFHQIATHEDLAAYVDPDRWQDSAVHHAGSWWPCWQQWLARYSGTSMEPPPICSRRDGMVPLCRAPGTYVLMP